MSKALKGAEQKGYKAAESGKSKDDCPYLDLRKGNGKLTWSRAFRNAWFKGYNEFISEDNERVPTSC